MGTLLIFLKYICLGNGAAVSFLLQEQYQGLKNRVGIPVSADILEFFPCFWK